MNPTKLKLTNPTDDELSAAVATHVAKWHWAPLMSDPLGMWIDSNGMHCQAPELPFVWSADAVLPLLEKHDAIITHSVKERDWRVVIEGGRCNSAPTLPRAACLALLRAHGVEVVT